MNELAGGIRKRGLRINGHYHELSQLKGSLIDAFRKMIKKKISAILHCVVMKILWATFSHNHD